MEKSEERKTAAMDPVWEQRYASGVSQRYPWSQVVSFVMRNLPADKPRNGVNILEVGCGTGGNLWFAAREGFNVTGFDGSPSAIEAARHRFEVDGLKGEFRVARFEEMRLPENTFDLVIDRSALTCAPLSMIASTISAIRGCLVPGGRFLFTPHASQHYSVASAQRREDGLAIGMNSAHSAAYGTLSFLDEEEVHNLFRDGWKLLQLQLNQHHDVLNGVNNRHAEWEIVAEKVG